MTEIHCPACSALLKLSLADPGSESHQFAQPQQPVIESPARKESARLAEFNASLAAALTEFVAVHPWVGHRLPGDIHADFLRWCRESPDDSLLRRFLRPPITKNRLSKLLVSEIGATFFKGPRGREYRLPEPLQPAGGGDTRAGLSVVPEPEVPLTVGGGLVPAARAELAGEGSLELAGVASLPLAAHVAAVKAQAAAEDAGVDYMFVTRDGVRHKVPLKSRGDVASLVKEEAMQEPADYSLPANLVLDGPSIIPVEIPEGMEAPPRAVWRFELTDDEAAMDRDAQDALFCSWLHGWFTLAGETQVSWSEDGSPWLVGEVILVDEVGDLEDGVVPLAGRVAYGLSDPFPPADEGPLWLPPGEDVAEANAALERARAEAAAEVAEADAAPLPSSAELAAVAGHEALERARTAAAPAAPVFLAPEDLDAYEGADPGDWG